jgi:hypothetical protein
VDVDVDVDDDEERDVDADDAVDDGEPRIEKWRTMFILSSGSDLGDGDGVVDIDGDVCPHNGRFNTHKNGE